MPYLVFVLLFLGTITWALGGVCLADGEKGYEDTRFYYSHPVSFNVILDEDGYSQGSLFRTPAWIIAQIDPDIMSTVLDRGPVPTSTENLPSYDEYIDEGYSALDGGDYRAAYTAFKKATELGPSSSDAWYGFGSSLEKQGRYLSALDAYSQAISFAKGAASGWRSYGGKGRTLFHLNRFKEAAFALETAIEQYDKAGESYPDELTTLKQLLEESYQKTGHNNNGDSDTYVPAYATV